MFAGVDTSQCLVDHCDRWQKIDSGVRTAARLYLFRGETIPESCSWAGLTPGRRRWEEHEGEGGEHMFEEGSLGILRKGQAVCLGQTWDIRRIANPVLPGVGRFAPWTSVFNLQKQIIPWLFHSSIVDSTTLCSLVHRRDISARVVVHLGVIQATNTGFQKWIIDLKSIILFGDIFKGCRLCRRPRKQWQRIKPNNTT